MGDKGGLDERGLNQFFKDGAGDFKVLIFLADLGAQLVGAFAAGLRGEVEPVSPGFFADEVLVFGALPIGGEVNDLGRGEFFRVWTTESKRAAAEARVSSMGLRSPVICSLCRLTVPMATRMSPMASLATSLPGSLPSCSRRHEAGAGVADVLHKAAGSSPSATFSRVPVRAVETPSISRSVCSMAVPMAASWLWVMTRVPRTFCATWQIIP